MNEQKKAMEDEKHPYWGELSSTTVNYVDYLTNSHDMIVEILPDVRPVQDSRGQDIAPVYFSRTERKIFIDATTAFKDKTGDIANYLVDVSRKRDRDLFPLFTGMLAHGIGHEKYTRYVISDITPKGDIVTSLEREIVALLEEPRMEGRMAQNHPELGCYLMSFVHHVILKPLLKKFVSGAFDRNDALSLFLLVNLRISAGVIPSSFLPEVMNRKMQELLGDDNVRVLRYTLSTLPYSDDDYDAMVSVARKVIQKFELKEEQPKNPIHSPQVSFSEDNNGSSGNSSDSSCEGVTSDSTASESTTNKNNPNASETSQGVDLTDEQKELFDEILKQAEQEMAQHQKDIQNGEAFKSIWEDNSSESKEEAYAKNQNQKAVTEREKRSYQSQLDAISGLGSNYKLPLSTKLFPVTAEEKKHAQMLYQAIRKAQYRADGVSLKPLDTPHGRMVVKQAVRRSIQRDRGVEITAKPWNMKVREPVLNPPLLMGVAMDISGTMERYIPSFMRYMWSLNEAVLLNDGVVSNVLWGGSHQTFNHSRNNIEIPSRGLGSSSGLPNALKKLSMNCNFTRGAGAKVVFVITDSLLPSPNDIVDQLRMLRSFGVQVIWVSTTETNRNIYEQYSHFIYMRDPSKFYEVMTPEVVRALENSQGIMSH